MLSSKQMLAATDCKKVSVIAAPSIVFPFESINGCLRTRLHPDALGSAQVKDPIAPHPSMRSTPRRASLPPKAATATRY